MLVVLIVLSCINIVVSAYCLLSLKEVKAKQKKHFENEDQVLIKLSKLFERELSGINSGITKIDRKVDNLSIDSPIE